MLKFSVFSRNNNHFVCNFLWTIIFFFTILLIFLELQTIALGDILRTDKKRRLDKRLLIFFYFSFFFAFNVDSIFHFERHNVWNILNAISIEYPIEAQFNSILSITTDIFWQRFTVWLDFDINSFVKISINKINDLVQMKKLHIHTCLKLIRRVTQAHT